jgi:ABC-type multidrug transport system fused ATPase/permease subunit
MLYSTSNNLLLAVMRLVSNAVFLVRIIGWEYFLIGVGASLVIMPLSKIILRRYNRANYEQRKARGRRSSIMSDALKAIRQIKISAAEDSWIARIASYRQKEMEYWFRSAIWKTALVFHANVGPVFLTGVPISIFALRTGRLDASIAFTCLDLFQNLQSNISNLPLPGRLVRTAWESLQRLEEFFMLPDFEPIPTIKGKTPQLHNATVTWPGVSGSRRQFLLKSVSVRFPEGCLSIITGETAAGKSLLLASLAGETTLVDGTIQSPRQIQTNEEKPGIDQEESWNIIGNRFALVSQTPWIDDTTIRANILFGLPFNEHRYRQVLHSCALEEDLQLLKSGDQTLTGPAGAGLSGGQKWRIALARALYSRAGTVLLDDILSAVDAEVRTWLVDNALRGPLAKARTIVLATHHLQHCFRHAASVVTLSGGTAVETTQPQSETRAIHRHSKSGDHQKRPLGQQEATIPNPSRQVDQTGQSTGLQKPNNFSTLSPYRIFFHATGGASTWPFICLVTVLPQLTYYATTRGLARWTSQDFGVDGLDAGQLWKSVGIFTLSSAAHCLAIALSSVVWYLVGTKASKLLFEPMTRSIFASSLQWLEETPHGEILHRFISDMDVVEGVLPISVGSIIECLINIFSPLTTM